jgi:hypothetical protein
MPGAGSIVLGGFSGILGCLPGGPIRILMNGQQKLEA